MAYTATERKQVLAPTAKTSAIYPVTSVPTPRMTDGSLHGKTINLTILGTGAQPFTA